MDVKKARLTASYRPVGPDDAVDFVRVYVWNEKAGRDGIGALDLQAESDTTQ